MGSAFFSRRISDELSGTFHVLRLAATKPKTSANDRNSSQTIGWWHKGAEITQVSEEGSRYDWRSSAHHTASPTSGFPGPKAQINKALYKTEVSDSALHRGLSTFFSFKAKALHFFTFKYLKTCFDFWRGLNPWGLDDVCCAFTISDFEQAT